MTNKNPRQMKALAVALLTILATFCCSSLLFPVILAAGQSDLSAPAGVTPHCDFAFKDAKLSVNAQNCPLANIADFLSSKAGVAVVMTADTGTEELSLNLSDVPLDDGLKQVFQQQDAFLFYGARQDGPATVQAVWVYSRGKGQGLAPVPPEKWASTSELDTMLSDQDPQTRINAIDTVVERKGQHAIGEVLKGLKDGDRVVRANTLFAAVRSNLKLPPQELRNLARNDESGDVRFLALQALDEHDPELPNIAQAALNDPNPVVRSQARQILSKLNPPPEVPQSDENRPPKH